MSKILGGEVNLFLGGKQDAKAKSMLQNMKIRYIMNCTPPRAMDPETGCPNFFEKEKAFVYKRIPVFDNRGEDLLQYMEESFRFIEEGKHYGGILVHCHKGVSRSASFVIGYLMRKNEMSLDEALEYTKDNVHSVARLYPGKPIVITEAGWATRSNGRGIQPENVSQHLQAIYYEDLMQWSLESGMLVFVFEAFDEPWKGSPDPLEPEKHWGLFDVDRKPKQVMQELFAELVG